MGSPSEWAYGRWWDGAPLKLIPERQDGRAWDMSNNTSGRRCRGARRLQVLGIGIALVVACNVVAALPAHAGKGVADRVTGSVTIEHVGNHPDGAPGSALVEFEAFEATTKHDARGTLELVIANSGGEVGRRITVRVIDVAVDGASGAFLGIVTADIRSDPTSGGDGHDEPGHDEPGHETGHDEPGHDTGHDAGPGDHATGRDRTGQLMAVKVVDGGSPGRMDTLDWKWFVAGAVTLEDVVDMGRLCDRGPKAIIGGNLSVHVAPVKVTKAGHDQVL